MLRKEYYKTRIDGVNLVKTYSDKGLMIRKINTNELYQEAIDVEDSNFKYEETDIEIETEELE